MFVLFQVIDRSLLCILLYSHRLIIVVSTKKLARNGNCVFAAVLENDHEQASSYQRVPGTTCCSRWLLVSVLSDAADISCLAQYSSTFEVHCSRFGSRLVILLLFRRCSWLHTGAHGCAFELCQNIPTEKYIAFFMSRINMLLYYKVTPVVVFDGGRLPIKDEVEQVRARLFPRFVFFGRADFCLLLSLCSVASRRCCDLRLSLGSESCEVRVHIFLRSANF